MPSANLAAYLAKNYLTASSTSKSPSSGNPDFADSSRPKKKRRKNKDDQTSGLMIADDDADLSIQGANTRGDEDDDTPMHDMDIKSAEFRKKKSSGWTVVSTASAPATVDTTGELSRNDEDAEADRIISEAAAESARRRQEIDDEDAPAVVNVASTSIDNGTGPKMQSGGRAGLQTAADTARLMEVEEREKEKTRKSKKSKANDEPVEETIYRDATGRRIDVSLKRAEARRAELEKIAAEKKAREDAMGDVQLREREERKKDLDEAKFLALARGADDEDMNREMKDVVRWDDPMAMYMAQKRSEEQALTRASRSTALVEGNETTTVRKKVFQGSAPPNRYGILPGWRWDGVDRGNGFEKEWFQARGKKARNEDLNYQWQMDE